MEQDKTRLTRRPSTYFFGMALATTAVFGVMMTPAAGADHWSTYRNSNSSSGSVYYGLTGNIAGGSSQATIGETGNSYIRTYNVFGQLVHSQTATHSSTATMTHTLRFDGKSACLWRLNAGATNSGPKPLQCRECRVY